MKKLLTFLPLILSSVLIASQAQTIFMPEAYTCPKDQITPENTTILSDMHGVFMHPKENRIVGTIWNYDRKMDIVRNFNGKTVSTIFRYLSEKIGVNKPKTNPEHIFQSAQEAGNTALVDLIIDISSQYEPMEETIAVFFDLKQQKYQFDLGSNVADSTFKEFRKEFPRLFDIKNGLFTNYHIITIDTPRKPNIEYFTLYNKTYNTTDKHIIFIDDKLKNVRAAQKAGMIAIHFISAEQLAHDLETLGIKVKNN